MPILQLRKLRYKSISNCPKSQSWEVAKQKFEPRHLRLNSAFLASGAPGPWQLILHSGVSCVVWVGKTEGGEMGQWMGTWVPVCGGGSVSDTTVPSHSISRCWCVWPVVKFTCNLLLVIAANGFLLESVQDCPIITLLSLAFWCAVKEKGVELLN